MTITAPPRRRTPASSTRPRGSGPVPPHPRSARRRPPRRGRRRRDWRVAGSVLVVVMVAAALVGRLTQVQVLEPDAYVAWGAQQRIEDVELPAARGAIVDRNGVDLAVSVPRPTLWADPRLVDDPLAVATRLSPLLGVPVDVLADRLSRDAAFVFLDRQVDPAIAEQVLALELPGVATYDEPHRYNPNGDVAKAVLGRAGIDHEGISGLELAYTDLLTGEPGELVYERAPDGATIPDGRFDLRPAVEGDTLRLTLDLAIQFELERLLSQQVTEVGARRGMAVVAEVATGDILAMAAVGGEPGLPVTNLGENLPVTWAFEPGSIVKPLTVAGLLEAGAIEAKQWFEVAPSLTVYDAEFADDPPRYVSEPMQPKNCLRLSSNVCTIMMAQQGDEQLLYDTLRRFGLGGDPELDLPGETQGILPPTDQWSGVSLPTIAIGQGVATSLVQMLDAYLVIANGGLAVPARLVDATIDGDGEVTELERPTPARLFSEATMDEVTEMLVAVVGPESTGTLAAIPGYSVAGKTGTGWQPKPEGGYGADGDRHIVASFAGFAPADDPQLVVLVTIDDPSGDSHSGGTAAAPLFAEVMAYALRQLDVAPGAESGFVPVESERARATPLVDVTDPADPDADGTDPSGAAEPLAEYDD